MQRNTQVPVGKHNNRQHAFPHHEVATDVKQMPIRPIIIIIIIMNRVSIGSDNVLSPIRRLAIF